MVDTCATCIFSRTGVSEQGSGRSCNRDAPAPGAEGAFPWAWPVVPDDGWCGDGADSGTGISFAKNVTNLPQQQATNTISGSFTPTAGFASYTISEARMAANMSIMVMAQNVVAGTFVQAHGLLISGKLVGSGFSVLSADGTNFAGTEVFYYLAG